MYMHNLSGKIRVGKTGLQDIKGGEDINAVFTAMVVILEGLQLPRRGQSGSIWEGIQGVRVVIVVVITALSVISGVVVIISRVIIISITVVVAATTSPNIADMSRIGRLGETNVSRRTRVRITDRRQRHVVACIGVNSLELSATAASK